MKQPIIASTPIQWSDLNGESPTEEELRALITDFRRMPTFLMLCMLNTFLSFYAHDVEKAIAVQEILCKSFIEPDLIKRLEQKFGAESMLERPVFHRQQLLALLKEVLITSSEDGEKDPNPNENTAARYQLGRSGLLVNNLLFPTDQEERLLRVDDPDEDERIHGELFAQWLPTSELLNPPDVVQSIIRSLEYARIFDEKFSEFTFAEGRSLSQRFQKLTGIELKRYLTLIFNFYLFYKEQSASLEGLLANPGLLNVDVTTVFSKMKLTEGEVSAFFRLTATDIQELIGELRNPPQTKHPILPQYDFTSFRRYPMVYNSDNKTVVTCIDPAFLAEKCSTGAYHTILKSFPTEDNKPIDGQESDREKFLRRWGEVFETYVNKRIEDIFPASTNHFYNSPKWNSPKSRANDEAFDGVLDCDDALIVMEHKGKYLEFSAKYSGNREILLNEIHERFGKSVRQLASNLEVIFTNDTGRKRHTFSERSSDGEVIRQYDIESTENVRRIYPVLIVQDFSLRIGFANRELRNSFAKEISTRSIAPDLVKPLSLLTVEDLENLLPYLDEVSFTDILDEYIKPHEPLYSFHNIFTEYLRKKKIEFRPNKWMDERFEEMRLSVKDQFSVLD